MSDSKRDEIAAKMLQRRKDVLDEREKNFGLRKENSIIVKEVLSQLEAKIGEIDVDLRRLTGLTGGAGDAAAAGSSLDETAKNISTLEKFLGENADLLPLYEVKRIQKEISRIDAGFKSVQDVLLPKKKFGFKSKKQNLTSKKEAVKVEKVTLKEEESGFVIKDRRETTIRPSKGQITNNDVLLQDLTDCRVQILGTPSTVHVTGLTRCRVILGPVRTSVFVDDCCDCEFVLACQQLRTHRTNNSSFYIHVTSKAIIEDCAGVRFAPYGLEYDGLEADFGESGLNRRVNNWNDVDDFNLLYSEEKSPNWRLIRENERETFKV